MAQCAASAFVVVLVALVAGAVAQRPDDPLPTWHAPGKGNVRLQIAAAPTRPAPCVLIAGDAPFATRLARALAAGGITAAILARVSKETLPAADGLLGVHADELGIDAAPRVLVAVGDGAEAAMDFVHEGSAGLAGFAVVDCVAHVVEGLRGDVPVRVIGSADVDTRVRAGQRELVHQTALAGAPVVWREAADAVAEVVLFATARLLPAPTNTADVAAGWAWEHARAAADRRDVPAAVRWLDRALAVEPAWNARLAADQGFARVRGDTAFRQFVATRAPAGVLQLTPEGEPGRAMHVSCRFVDGDGKPITGVIDVWQTDASGTYNLRGGPDDVRLAGSVRTTAQGTFELRSVRPGGYPATMIPAHVHVRVPVGGRPREVELLFADDPRLSPALAERLVARGFAVTQLDADGRGVAEFRLPAR